jgi:hypothetical protein
MTWQVTGKQKFPAVIGEPFGGGFFAGYISHTADGNPTHALIVAPRATGATGTGYTLTTNLLWADSTVNVPASATLIGANSVFDGKANTDLMMSLIADSTYSAGAFPAAQFCADLSIGGFADWYLPARLELDIAYENLKPTTAVNNEASGINDYAVPKRTANRKQTGTAQTYVAEFKSIGSEPFQASQHRSSTEATALAAWNLFFDSGRQASGGAGVPNKSNSGLPVRAFRRIAL